MLAQQADEIALESVLANRRWVCRDEPFPHFRADGVFVGAFYTALVEAARALLARGLSAGTSAHRFSRNMPNSDAYGWNFPPDLGAPFSLFYSRAWHEMLATLTGVAATGDVNGALHYHHVGSGDGTVHRDLGAAWFSAQPRRDGINPMDLRRCSYTHGDAIEPGVATYMTVRAITMIFYFANPRWHWGDGGETGLYRSPGDPVERPAALAPPINNSVLVFENTPGSWHSFRRNQRFPRTSAILWLHREPREVANRWGEEAIARW